jgi:hypothetical protein
MFLGTPRDGHGHHQVSALLGKEAYAVAGDTVRFPVRDFGPAWTPLKLYQTARFQPDSATIRINVGEYNPELRRSYAEIAGESRSQHKSQGFGALQRKGVVWNYITRIASRVNESTPAKSEKSLFDGVVPRQVDLTNYGNTRDFQKHVALEAVADRQYVALGDSARIALTFYNRSTQSLLVTPESTPQMRTTAGAGQIEVPPDSAARWVMWFKATQLDQPWWLTSPRNGDLFSPSLPRLEHPFQWFSTSEDQRERRQWARVTMDPGGGVHLFHEASPVVFRLVDPVRGDIQRPIAVVPPISVTLDNATEIARANTNLDRFVNVTLRSAMMTPQSLRVSLTLPRGLTADSGTRTVTVDSVGTRRITFRVRGTLPAGDHNVSVTAIAGGQTYTSGYIPLDYDHITPQRLYRQSVLKLRALDVRVPANTNVAYVRGVGDNVSSSLEQLGIPVTMIEPLAIPTVDLSRFSAVVIGPRAYDAHRELMDNNTYLLDYARNGGTLVVQYGQYEMTRPGVMPYPISIARPHDRVTEETAPVRILEPSAAALSQHNPISAPDFDGWIQERILYMPRTFDEHYRPLVELSDPGAPPNRGGILITPYGRGLYVYTTLAFFRQLPGGVSGATRLFVNLLSLKPGSAR